MFEGASISFFASDNPEINMEELGFPEQPGQDLISGGISFLFAKIVTTLDLLDYVNNGNLDKFYIRHENIEELVDILEPVFAVYFDILQTEDPKKYCFIR